MDMSTATGTRRSRLVSELLEIVDEAGRHGRSWTPSPAFERAVTRWSRHADSPLDVLVLVGEARALRRHCHELTRVLEHVSLVAVGAVSDRMVREALTDCLTGLATRARLEDEVERLVAASLRSGSPLTAVVLDVDGLKQINDTHGHAAGDAAIAEVGRAIRSHLRRVDRAFRVGGDEFALFLPDSTAEAARSVVERIQRHCATSVSVGVATHSGRADDLDVGRWLQHADEAMYEQRQQLRALVPRVARRSGRARAAGLVLAAGVSVGAWAGIATAVQTVASTGAPTPQVTAPARTAPVGAPATETVALPRTVGPVLTAVPATRPRTTTTAAAPDTGRPPRVAPPVAVPPVPAVAVPQVPLPAEPVQPPTSGGSGGLVRSLLGTVAGVLRTLT